MAEIVYKPRCLCDGYGIVLQVLVIPELEAIVQCDRCGTRFVREVRED